MDLEKKMKVSKRLYFWVIYLCNYRFELHKQTVVHALTANASANHLASSSANALPVNINIAFWLTVASPSDHALYA